MSKYPSCLKCVHKIGPRFNLMCKASIGEYYVDVDGIEYARLTSCFDERNHKYGCGREARNFQAIPPKPSLFSRIKAYLTERAPKYIIS